MSRGSHVFDKASRGHVLLAILTVALCLVGSKTADAAKPATEASPTNETPTTVIGSGASYRTTVSRETEGELSAEDLHQASLLTSRIVDHLNKAVADLTDAKPETAKPEMENALTLAGIVKELLPVTKVTTVVANADGQCVYRDVDEIRDDRIPLYRGMITMNVVEPVVAAADEGKQEVGGLRLADARVVRTSVLADLSYIARKLNRAVELVDTPDEALAQLRLAQTEGIEIIVNEKDNPLVDVQQALRIAERMVKEGKHEAARENLELARVHLQVYRGLVDKPQREKVETLEDEISALMSKTREEGAAAKIRGYWERAVSWFRDEPGKAKVVKQPEASGGDTKSSEDSKDK